MIRTALLLACVVVNIIPRYLPSVNGEQFCMWQSVSFVLIAAAGIGRGAWWEFVFLLALGNAIDEIFKVAQHVSYSEYWYAIVVTLWTIYRLKCRTKPKT
jgi:integral membrane sensor domain MASE1